MRIAGFQPCSLLDFPGKVAAIVFTQGCPFACTYCHNPELIPSVGVQTIAEEDVFTLLAARKGFLDGVVVTGGEPTVQPDLLAFLARIRDMGFLVKLDSNGVHPKVLAQACDLQCVDFIAMDVKHVPEKYGDIVGKIPEQVVYNIRESMRIIAQSGIAYEFRTTTDETLHSVSDVLAIAQELPLGARYALQYMRRAKTRVPFQEKLSQATEFFSEIQQVISCVRPDIILILRT